MKKLFLMNVISLLGILLFTMAGYAQNKDYIGNLNDPLSFKTPKTGDVLFDQMYNPGTSFMLSQQYSTITNNTESCAAADDFDIPAGETWDIHSIGIVGSYWQGAPGGGDTLNVFILNDNNGVPGDTLYEYIHYTNFLNIEEMNGLALGTYFEIYLPSIVTLSEGTYWISVQMYSDFNATGKWGWMDHYFDYAIYGAEWQWINPKDGFGFGFTDWTPASVVAGPWLSWELSFAIFGPPDDNDLSVQKIVSPEDYYYGPPSDPQPVTIRIKNEGSTPQTGFDVKYDLNGTEVVENVGSVTLDYNETYDYTFVQTVDLSTPGLYNLNVFTQLSGDENPDNDEQAMDITVFDPTVYTMPSYSTGSITACSGTFADAGGLGDSLTVDDWGVMTIYPATTGAKIRLDFIQFDIEWSEFYIYDGENTLA
ncbi:MAG: hypothetical protein KDC05_17390, partial [Bacteroidales bacterium]|nr:hypothetical protein [Bacteroidales bacterium]